jgi:hypothetical protein
MALQKEKLLEQLQIIGSTSLSSYIYNNIHTLHFLYNEKFKIKTMHEIKMAKGKKILKISICI